MAEADGHVGRALDVEVVGVVERPGVAGGRPGEQQHRVAGGDGAALERAVLDREPPLVLGRRQVAEDLLHRPREHARVVLHLLPLVGMAGEQHGGVAHQLGHRLGARPAQQAGEPGDLAVVQAGLHPVAPVHRDLGQPRQHVVGRVLPLLDGQLVEVRARRPGRLPSLGRGLHLALLAVQADVDPLPHLLAHVPGDAQHAGDDLDRERRREVGHHVEGVAPVEPVEVGDDDLADHRLQGGHRPGGEHAADQLAEPVVLRAGPS